MPLTVDAVRARFPHRLIQWKHETTSTMDDALLLARQGAPHGTVAGADAQTRGKGRHDRAWHSAPDTGLYLSVVLRLALEPAHLPVVTMALGLAVVEAIAKAAHLRLDLRWPNDVVRDDRKVAGILTQHHGDFTVAGIGINVNQIQFPDVLQPVATSLQLITGREHARESILTALLPAIDDQCDTLTRHGRDVILQRFAQASSYVRGKRVVIEPDGHRGITNGLTPEGFLQLRQDTGATLTILAGGVRPE